MSKTKEAADAQPLWTVAGLTAAASATIGLVVSFGLELSAEQQNSILTLVAVLAPTIVAWIGNRKVTPDNRVVAAVNKDTGKIEARNASVLPRGSAVEVWGVGTASHQRYDD